MLARSLKTANFLTINASRPFAWGDWDCNLFIVDLLDHLDAGLPWRSLAIRDKYHTKLGAARFSTNKIRAPDFFERNGFELIETDHWQEHDIILVPNSKFWGLHLFFANTTWSVLEDKALMKNTVEPGRYLIARYYG